MKDYLPPIIARQLSAIKNRRRFYSNFEQALKDCKTKGYDSEQLAAMVYQKTKNHIVTLQQHLPITITPIDGFLATAIAKINQKSLRVLDIGGALGTHYFVVKHLLPQITLDWTIIEMPAMVEKGRQLNQAGLQFHTQDSFSKCPAEQKAFDLVFSSATLQHVPEPNQTLDFMLSFQAPWLLFLRCGFTLEPENFWIIHKAWFTDNGPGKKPEGVADEIADFPFALLAKSQFESQINLRYQEVMSTNEPSGVIPLLEKQCIGMNRLYKSRT